LAARSLLAYGWLLFLLRLDGKREIGQAGAFNFVLALILGDLVDDVLWGEVPVALFLTATAALVATHVAVSVAAYRSEWVHRVVNGSGIPVVASGSILTTGLRRERMRRSELLAVLRTHGIEELARVRAGAIEETGQISVLLEDWAQAARRRDRSELS
jgi:uncharacterized membrane protein YcaP (DUF421 family)